ncbi:DNA-binding MarR family transcriptional regulator [Bradyrhizobium sp. LM6.10]
MKRKPSTEATSAWIRLMRVQSRVLDCVEQDLKKAGFPPLAWYDALLELSRAPSGELRPVELERQMLIPQYSTSRLIDRLVDEGLASRRECKIDKRGQFVEIQRSRPRIAEADVGRLFGRNREICRFETVRRGCRQAQRSARPPGLLVRRDETAAGRPRQRNHAVAMSARHTSSSVHPMGARTVPVTRAPSVEAPF